MGIELSGNSTTLKQDAYVKIVSKSCHVQHFFLSVAGVVMVQSTNFWGLKVRWPHMIKIIKKSFEELFSFTFCLRIIMDFEEKVVKCNTFLRVAHMFRV